MAVVPNDFNGDGKSDILWRNTDGTVIVWMMNGRDISSEAGGNNGAFIESETSLGSPSNAWNIVGTGDFNGDGTTDILWRNTDGSVILWEMHDGKISSEAGLGTIGNAWSIQGIGDFNGDGKDDILWRNTDGTTILWDMNGSAISYESTISSPSPDWKVATTGDFNADGRADIVWQKTDGTTIIWLMGGANGTQILSEGSIARPTAQSVIKGTGYFNADNKADILWQDPSNLNQITFQFMDGTSVASQDAPQYGGLSPVNIGDYNGDGMSDIVNQRRVGTEVVLMKGTVLVDFTLYQVASSWHVISMDTATPSRPSAQVVSNLSSGNLPATDLAFAQANFASAASNSIGASAHTPMMDHLVPQLLHSGFALPT